MDIIFSTHSLQRANERKINRKILLRAIHFPDRIDLSNKDSQSCIIKKVYYNESLGKDHLLMIICKKENNVLKVITIIDTSKISKYF